MLVGLFVVGFAMAYFITKNSKGQLDVPANVDQSGMTTPLPDNYGQSDDVVDGFNRGAIEKLASHFAEDVDLILLGEEDLLTAEEAKTRMATFFDEYPSEGFSVQHRGQSEGGENSYLIGNFRSGAKAYRTYIAFKNEKIIEIRVEN